MSGGGEYTDVNVFPEEVWEILLNKLKAPLDKFSCSKVCTQLDRVLQRNRVEIRFAAALQILQKNGFLNFIEALPLRKVCRTLKQAVDSYWQDMNVFLVRSQGPKKMVLRDPPGLMYTFSGVEDIQRFDDIFGPLAGPSMNPFILRELRLHFMLKVGPRNWPFVFRARCDFGDAEAEHENWIVNKGNDADVFNEGVMNMLSRFGGHVWYCVMRIWSPDVPPSEVYLETIKRSLCLMPNLRALNVQLLVISENPKLLANAADGEPLPVLPHLRSLALDCDNEGMRQQLLKLANPATLLHLGDNDMSMLRRKRFTAIENFRLGDPHRFQIVTTGFRDLLRVNWPLKKLVLAVGIIDTPFLSGTCTLVKLIEVVNHFADTLIHFELTVSGSYKYDSKSGARKELRFNLPLLRSLTFVAIPKCFEVDSLDFAAELHSLEELNLTLWRQLQSTEGIPTLKRFSRMWESNNVGVWQVLPKLTNLRLTIRKQPNSVFEESLEVVRSMRRPKF